jgi:hypothetical protein
MVELRSATLVKTRARGLPLIDSRLRCSRHFLNEELSMTNSPRFSVSPATEAAIVDSRQHR